MPRFHFLVPLAGAIALHPAHLASQPAPAQRTLATFRADSTKDLSVSPSGRFILLSTATKLRMYDVAKRQSWDLVNASAQALSWSPKGDRVAWTQGSGPQDANVWVLPVDASTGKARGAAQRLTTGRSATAEFSTDGQWIAFMNLGGPGQFALSVVPATGGPERTISSQFEWEGALWSADGHSIFVNGRVPPDSVGVFKVAVRGGSRAVLPAPRNQLMIGATADRRYLILSPKGVGATVGAGDRATIIDTAGRVVGHVPLPPGQVLGFPGGAVLGDSALVWITLANNRSVLEVRPVSGGSARRLPPVGESNTIPFWSPDGRRIAFLVSSSAHTSLAVMNADGTNAKSYPELDAPTNEFGVCWSPDSRFLAVHQAKGISVLDVSQGTTRTIVSEPIGKFGWRSDGGALLIRSRATTGAGIAEVTLDGHRRQLWDWPVPTKAINWTFIGDTSIFLVADFDTAVYAKPLGTGPARHLASASSDWYLSRPTLSNDGRTVATLLADRSLRPMKTTQIALFSLTTGTRRVLDLPFSWGPQGNPITFLPGDHAMLVFGRLAGEPGMKLFRVPVDGTVSTVFADVGQPLPDGEVFAASVSPDGKSVVYSVHPEPTAKSLIMIDLRGVLPRSSRPPR